MALLNNSDWKKRKEGLEMLQNLLIQNYNKISLKGLEDLITILKNKLSESNKGLIRNFI